ncbi:hypothetical protein BDZ45DRAFT_257530 [Acephala macrosclerotiorum]|nr:hypothetical protein BDZ45DRAFT_257530 [Acephala macrosclerotiorum]
MGFVNRGTQHHCPGENKPVDGYPGNCRYTGGYCATHQRLCSKHQFFAYMKSKTCALCDKAAKIDAAKKKKDGSGDGNGGGASGGDNSTSAKKRRKSSGGRDKGKFGKRPGSGKNSKSGTT